MFVQRKKERKWMRNPQCATTANRATNTERRKHNQQRTTNERTTNQRTNEFISTTLALPPRPRSVRSLPFAGRPTACSVLPIEECMHACMHDDGTAGCSEDSKIRMFNDICSFVRSFVRSFVGSQSVSLRLRSQWNKPSPAQPGRKP